MGCGCNRTPCECSGGGHPHGMMLDGGFHGNPADPRLNLMPGGFPGGPPCSCGKDPCECARGAIPPPPPTECSCQQSPCACKRCTLCDLYVQGTPNVWVERADVSADLFATATPDYTRTGICALDTLAESQVIHILERDDKARADLLKVTSNPRLRKLALTVPKAPTQELVDAEQLNQNRPNEPSSIPFYAVFRGQPPFPQ